jgi:hypothetical protein
MLTRARKPHPHPPRRMRSGRVLSLVFLIAVPLAGSVANLIPAPTQRPINPNYASNNPRPFANSNSTLLQHFVTPSLLTSRVYQEAASNEADLNDSYDVFYDQLSSEGHWIFAENYGYVFQPNIAQTNADWRPYTNGHWEATDRGWYWDTVEPFGWATYHYGRWANIDGAGWVWTPGIDWSPAWVSWRICDNGFIGWAPLPPECPRPSEVVPIGSWCDSYTDTGPGAFCFLPASAWLNSNYIDSLAPVTQNLELINASRNVTDISAIKTTISDFGPRPDLIAQETGKEVKTYVLHYSEVRGRNNFSRSINGNALNVNGPAAKLKANATKVPTVIKTLVKPTVNKGWNGLTKDDIDGVHRKYASEAHIPTHLPNKPIERVNLVPSATPAVIRPVPEAKGKQPKQSKETAKAARTKESKGKAGSASTHKGSTKHKTASESEEEGGSKKEGKSKGSSKVAKASKDTDDTDDSETPKKNGTSKTGGSQSEGGSKHSGGSKVSKASKDRDDTDDEGTKSSGATKSKGSKSSEGSTGEGTKKISKKSSDE